ncbi:uncharacterized protein K444DRAFT_374559 [Hyaloscypha bicolor E]|uniref:Uncharacterized protein n=1 Tax=Hyaloscypha bicolor E TaxID=1095630 RepID=A0A2J6TF30_9HELO|nr:uncharacterized protein K444DRAFT_374559 [Hyaloscypha bicolor E]PMD61612.1 hypothetical protein K444DRAFT_374559 [Hyaloscypha bicolor E]
MFCGWMERERCGCTFVLYILASVESPASPPKSQPCIFLLYTFPPYNGIHSFAILLYSSLLYNGIHSFLNPPMLTTVGTRPFRVRP